MRGRTIEKIKDKQLDICNITKPTRGMFFIVFFFYVVLIISAFPVSLISHSNDVFVPKTCFRRISSLADLLSVTVLINEVNRFSVRRP